MTAHETAAERQVHILGMIDELAGEIGAYLRASSRDFRRFLPTTLSAGVCETPKGRSGMPSRPPLQSNWQSGFAFSC